MTKVRQRQIKRHRDDFWAYCRFGRLLRGFCPWAVNPFPRGESDTLRCFVEWENGATILTPKHPRLLKAAIEGKKKLNWQISEWAAGIADGTLYIEENIKADFPWLPVWCFDAIYNSRWKLLTEKLANK